MQLIDYKRSPVALADKVIIHKFCMEKCLGVWDWFMNRGRPIYRNSLEACYNVNIKYANYASMDVSEYREGIVLDAKQ